MANTKKKTTSTTKTTTKRVAAKKPTVRKTAPKQTGLSNDDKRVAWLAVIVVTVMLIYLALTYFA